MWYCGRGKSAKTLYAACALWEQAEVEDPKAA